MPTDDKPEKRYLPTSGNNAEFVILIKDSRNGIKGNHINLPVLMIAWMSSQKQLYQTINSVGVKKPTATISTRDADVVVGIHRMRIEKPELIAITGSWQEANTFTVSHEDKSTGGVKVRKDVSKC